MWYLSADVLSNLQVFKGDDNQYYYNSYESGKRYQARPEEIIRQFLLIKLCLHYGISKESMVTEFPIQIGRTKKRADVVVLASGNRPHIIAEAKIVSGPDTIYQLQSYVNVTHARFGVIATQSEFLTFQSIDGELRGIPDLPVSADISGTRQSTEKGGIDMLGFEKLARVNESDSTVMIKGVEFSIRNSDLISFQKIRKVAISKGIVLPLNVGEVYWSQIVQNLFENASSGAHGSSAIPRKPHELEAYLRDCEERKDGPFQRASFGIQEMISYIEETAPDKIQHILTVKSLSRALQQIGYRSHEYRSNRDGLSQHRRLWFKGSRKDWRRLASDAGQDADSPNNTDTGNS